MGFQKLIRKLYVLITILGPSSMGSGGRTASPRAGPGLEAGGKRTGIWVVWAERIGLIQAQLVVSSKPVARRPVHPNPRAATLSIRRSRRGVAASAEGGVAEMSRAAEGMLLRTT
jgi:hypothetical protein